MTILPWLPSLLRLGVHLWLAFHGRHWLEMLPTLVGDVQALLEVLRREQSANSRGSASAGGWRWRRPGPRDRRQGR